MPKLTPELLRVFIRRIEVYEKFEKYSRTAGNPIRIHYAFRLPEQEGIPAIEVLAQPTAKTAQKVITGRFLHLPVTYHPPILR